MGTFQDYCWQAFTPVLEHDIDLDKLRLIAQEHGSQPFVFHDRSARRSALVFPEFVSRVLSGLEIPGATRAADIGLFDLLGRRQMVVAEATAPEPIFRLALRHGIDAVIAVNQDQVPRGLMLPTVVAERLPHASIVRDNLSDLRSIGAAAGTSLDDAIRAVDEVVRRLQPGHVSERLNYAAPDPYVCSGGKDGPHTPIKCPCPEPAHRAATCGRQEVANE